VNTCNIAKVPFTILPLVLASILLGQAPAPSPTGPATAPSPLATDLAELKKAMATHDLEGLDGWIVVQAKARYTAWRAAADKGDAVGQFFVGRCYQAGAEVPRNRATGVTWLRKAADQQFGLAIEDLGHCYRYGKGVRASYDEAIKHYKLAASLGTVPALVDLGEMFQEENGGMLVGTRGKFPADHAEGLRCLREAAQKGDTWGMFGLGIAYEEGKGVDENLDEALVWYQKSASAGNIQGMIKSAQLLRQKRRFNEAIVWLRRGIEAGDSYWRATMRLADMYEAGEGVPRDHNEAVRLYELADNAGELDALSWLAEFR
jgi:uncharacterized protein